MPPFPARAVAFAPLAVLTALTLVAAGTALRDSGPAVDGHATASPTSTATDPAPPPAASPTDPPQPTVTLRQARKQWDAAAIASIRKGTGRYEWTVWIAGVETPFMEESGVFGFDPLRTSFTRTITNPDPKPGDPGSFTMTMIRRDHQTYMRMAGWGAWEGCWLHLSASALEGEITQSQKQLIGLVADSPEIPTAIAVPLNSTVTKTSADYYPAPYVEYTAQVSMLEALGFVGINARLLLPKRAALLKVKAPIIVAIGVDGRPYGAAVIGQDLATALARSKIGLGPGLPRYLQHLIADVSFTDLGSGAKVKLPAAARVLPDHATRKQTCPARR